MSYYSYGTVPEAVWPRPKSPLGPGTAQAPGLGGGIGMATGGMALPRMGPAVSAPGLGMAQAGPVLGPIAGPGTGRSDEIPAQLSDGEYVFDAETVALLGDGSTEAGARALDEMREQIRAHKGKALAKGKISPDAMPPLSYLMGGE